MSEQPIEFRVQEEGGRLDKYLVARLPHLSRSAGQRLITSGAITVNGEPVKASYKVRSGDVVVVLVPAEQSAQPAAEAIPLRIVYEDATLLVVDKPAGMVVHPAAGHSGGTLVNAVLAHCPDLAADGDKARPGIVHRLDRDTSGLILIAKSERVQRLMQRQFKDRQVRKVYLALVDGHLQPAWGRIEAPLGRDPHHRQRMAVLPGGRDAVTEYHVLEQFCQRVGPAAGEYTLVQVEPKTGRTHQIRVHLASIGHPVVGDRVYGRRRAPLRRRTPLPLTRQFLHAQRLEFMHPVTGQHLALEAPLADDLAAVLALLRQG